MGVMDARINRLPVVLAELSYLGGMSERPRNYAYDPPPGVPRNNTIAESHRVAIRDLRPIAKRVSLDREGVAVVAHATAVRNAFFDDDEIHRVYYPESEEVIRRATGANRIFIFDHTIRRKVPGADGRREGPRQPVLRVHVDHTEKSGPQRVRDLLPRDAEHLLKGRVQVINLWRPIRGPVLDSPLAVCDAASIDPSDLVGTDLVYRERTGETYSVRFNPQHRWYYLSRMQTDEVLLIKCYDSKTDGRARFAPHSAFIDPNVGIDAPPRESIEIRALVFHQPKVEDVEVKSA